ncbi:MAG: CoA-binding protein [Desulfobacterales bacterium]
MKTTDFQPIFRPRSIAVIGASSDPVKFGGRTYLSARDRRDQELVFAVNPNVAEIDGEKTFDRLQDIDEPIDLVIITVPAPFVVQAIRDCAEKKVHAVEILTAGFKETGDEEGSDREQQIVTIAREAGMRIVGPNCFGIYSPESPLTILPGPDYPKETGPLGILAQSGGFTSNLARRVLELGIRINKAVSYGNACDLNEIDFLSYFRDDASTRTVAAYVEGVRKGRAFLDLVKDVSLKKPVIMWKGGLTGQGGRAVASHTASLGGDGEIWQGFFQQTGAVPVVGIDEMVDAIIGFHCIPDYQAKRVSVVGGGGAIVVSAADALEKEGMSIHPFSDETQQAIRSYLPPHGNSVKNPVDMGSPMFIPQTFKPILEAVAASDQVDAVIIEQLVFLFRGDFDEDLAEAIASVRDASGKPFIMTLPQTSTGVEGMDIEQSRRKYREWYLSRSIPVFDSLERAVNVLGKIIRYNAFKAGKC